MSTTKGPEEISGPYLSQNRPLTTILIINVRNGCCDRGSASYMHGPWSSSRMCYLIGRESIYTGIVLIAGFITRHGYRPAQDSLERHADKRSHRRHRVEDQAPGFLVEIYLIVADKDAIHLIGCA